MAKREQTPAVSANIAAAVISSLVIVLMGVLMVLSGIDVLPVAIRKFWGPALMVGAALCMLTTGFCRKETFWQWAGWLVIACAIPVIVNAANGASYSVLYPLFIAAPGIASLMTIPFAANRLAHLQGIILFGGLSVIFALKVLVLVKSWLLIAGIVVIMLGLFAFVNVITSRRGRWDDGDRPQRPRGKKWDDGDRPQRRDDREGK